nr:hypothetical protein [Tanacetum cinerariifolium]
MKTIPSDKLVVYKNFEILYVNAFVRFCAWEVLKHISKWRLTKPVVSRRRHRIDVGEGMDLEDLYKLFRDDPLSRHPDKPRRTKTQKSDSAATVGSSPSGEAFKEMV